MRFYGFALTASALAVLACGGGEKNVDSVAVDTTPAVTPTPSPSTPATGTAAPITGTTHEVRMTGDATGYQFVPAAITIKAGDGIKFIAVSGFPHNVAADRPR